MSSLPHYPATHRNRKPIWETIQPYLSTCSRILEIASGSGEHIEYMAARSPQIQWQPSDQNPNLMWAIDERNSHLPNVLRAKHIDVCSNEWHSLSYDVLFCANMIHISAWASTLALFAHANPAQYLILYGPFKENGQHNSQGNINFDAALRSQHPDWGIRDITTLCALGEKHGISLLQQHPMPANNRTLIWKKQ